VDDGSESSAKRRKTVVLREDAPSPRTVTKHESSGASGRNPAVALAHVTGQVVVLRTEGLAGEGASGALLMIGGAIEDTARESTDRNTARAALWRWVAAQLGGITGDELQAHFARLCGTV
jgi:hypothetical protein